MNALTELKNMPFTKMEQAEYVNQAVMEILSGDIDPLAADVRLKAMSEVIDNIRKDLRVKNAVIEEAEKYGKSFEFAGINITVTQKTVKDFAGCDQVLDGLYSDQEKIKAQIKAREATVAAGTDPATGEVFPPFKTSTTQFLTYKFK